MREDEFESLAMLLDYIESARIIAGAKFENYCNQENYGKALIFMGLRDNLDNNVKVIKDYMYLDKRGEEE